MFGIAWSELLIIGVVALVVIPPKDLPSAMRAVGKWVSQMRRMAFDFQHQVSAALREAELDDLKKSVTDLTSGNPLAGLRTELESVTKPLTHLEGQLRSEFGAIESGVNQINAPEAGPFYPGVHDDLSAPPVDHVVDPAPAVSAALADAAPASHDTSASAPIVVGPSPDVAAAGPEVDRPKVAALETTGVSPT